MRTAKTRVITRHIIRATDGAGCIGWRPYTDDAGNQRTIEFAIRILPRENGVRQAYEKRR
jgi:hypothetical protein